MNVGPSEEERVAFTVLGALAIAAVAFGAHAHFARENKPHSEARTIVDINAARHVAKPAKELGRVCPRGQFCRVVGDDNGDRRRVKILDADRTAVMDDYELLVVGPGERVTELAAPTGKRIVDVALDAHGDLYAVDQTAWIVKYAKDGKSSRIYDRLSTTIPPQPHAKIIFQNDKLFLVFGTHLFFQKSGDKLEEIQIPGLNEEESSTPLPPERIPRFHGAEILFTLDGNERGYIAYSESPSPTERGLARVYRYDHGLVTDFWGTEDQIIEAIAPGRDDDAWIVMRESAYDSGYRSRLVVRHRDETIDVTDTDHSIEALHFDGKEACFAILDAKKAAWYSVSDPNKMPAPHTFDLDQPLTTNGAFDCSGHSRVALRDGNDIVDFDGSRILTTAIDDVHSELGPAHGLFADDRGHVNGLAYRGTFRVDDGSFRMLVDEHPTPDEQPHHAPDGSWWSIIENKGQRFIGRWDDDTWTEVEPIAERVEIAFPASKTEVFTSSPYEPSHALMRNGKVVATLAGFGRINSAYGSADNAFMIISGERGPGLFHWDGKKLAPVDDVPYPGALTANALDDVFVSNLSSKVFHFDGTGWQPMPKIEDAPRYLHLFEGERHHALFAGGGLFGDLGPTEVTSEPFAPDGIGAVTRGKTSWIVTRGALYRRDL